MDMTIGKTSIRVKAELVTLSVNILPRVKLGGLSCLY